MQTLFLRRRPDRCPAVDSDGVLALGNIFSDDLDEILSSKRARAMVTGFQNRNAPEDLCRRCGYARRFG